MQDTDENIELLHRIRDIGVQIALDDFGTDILLNYLRSFLFDRIKIDRRQRDIANKEDSDAIVNAVVGLQASSRCGPRPRAWSIPSSLNAFAQRAARPSRGSCSTTLGRPQSWNTVPSFALPVRSRRRCRN